MQAVAAVFGWSLDLTQLGDRLIAAADAIFALLAVCGVAIDPTTEGMGDSARAKGYDRPHSDDDDEEAVG